MATDAFERDLELLLRSRHAVIFLETDEFDRAEGLLVHLAERMQLPCFTWTRSKGLRQHFELGVSQATLAPLAALAKVEQEQRRGIYHFQGLGPDLADPALAAKLRDAARQFFAHEGGVVITGEVPDELPAILRTVSTTLDLPLPGPDEFRALAERLYHDLSRKLPIELQLTRAEFERLARNLQGLTLLEAEKVLTKAMIEDQRLGPRDILRVIEAKKAVIERDGLLEYYPAEQGLAEVAGLEGLKTWLAKRRAILREPERARAFGLEFPKGVLLVGMQGSGKSLSAKAVAADWGLPLLKMDPSSLYNKYIGESEKNFRRATRVAEQMAPVVLWIDEIEKAFASAGEMDGGVSQRVLGQFLGWLQERQGDVFVVATANDVSKLPPELVRKGRFDELFFVDLPDEPTRAAILALHLKKRQRAPEAFDLARLAAETEGFSGAELEQAVVSSLYSAFAEGGDLTTELLAEEIRATVPLSATMPERLSALRRWAEGRAVMAN